MAKYTLRRLVSMLPVLLLVTAITFALLRLVPGDAALAILGDEANAQALAKLREDLGLNKPLPQQYLEWVTAVARGDLGKSIVTNDPVLGMIGSRLVPTLELAALSLLLACLVAVPLGALAAVHYDSALDRRLTLVSNLGISMPHFWLGILLIFCFALQLRLLPPSGYVAFAESVPANAQLMILPALTVSAGMVAVLFRMVRSSMIETLGQQYVATARAKGLTERVVVFRHAFRNALIPVLTVIGLQIGHLISGVIVVETIFAIPGLGRLAVQSLLTKDFTVLGGVTLFITAGVLVINLVTDLTYAYVDPRIRYS